MKLKIYLAISLIWTAVWWILAWSHVAVLSENSFTPLWLGFIFTVNFVSEVFFGNSILRKLGWNFGWLFVISIPMWWSFELLNSVIADWHYLNPPMSSWHYFLQSTIDFSTVVPAVLSVYYLLKKLFKPKDKSKKVPKVTDFALFIIATTGSISLLACLLFSHELFALMWISPLLIIDPINYAMGLPSVLGFLVGKAYGKITTIAVSALLTGFFWEMWNFYSFPKWYYTVPYFGFRKIFEMPILGFLGYLPFGLLVWSFSILVIGVIKREWLKALEPSGF